MDLKSLMENCRESICEALAIGPALIDNSDFQEIYNQVQPYASSNKALSVLCEKLHLFITAVDEEKFRSLLELNTVVEKIAVSLIEFHKPAMVMASDSLIFTAVESKEVKYSEIKHLIQALKMTSGARLNLIREALMHDTYKSIQLLPYFVDNIDIRHAETAELIINEIIPYFGRSCIRLFQSRINFTYSVGQERLLKVLVEYMTDDEVKSFSGILLKKGDVGIKKCFLKQVNQFQIEKDGLLPLLKSKSPELRDLATGLFEKYT